MKLIDILNEIELSDTDYVSYSDGKIFIDNDKQLSVFENDRKMYNVKNANNVKFIKTLSKSELDDFKVKVNMNHIKGAGVYTDGNKLKWDY